MSGEKKEMSVNKTKDLPLFTETFFPTTLKWSGAYCMFGLQTKSQSTFVVTSTARKSNLKRIHRAFDPTGYIGLFFLFFLPPR
jgi:hypothetical protein